MICFGISNSISAPTIGFITKFTGRIPLMILAFILHLGLLNFLIFWSPTSEDRILYYIVPGLWGVCDSIWLIQVNGENPVIIILLNVDL